MHSRRSSIVAGSSSARQEMRDDEILVPKNASLAGHNRRPSVKSNNGCSGCDVPYAGRMLNQLYRFQENDQLCDVTLYGSVLHATAYYGDGFKEDAHSPDAAHAVSDTIREKNGVAGIRAHKCVLASVSSYFETLFIKEAFVDAQKNEFLIQSVSHSMLGHIIHFIYTGEANIGLESSFEEMLAAASYLQLTELIQICGQWLEQELNVSNCLAMRALAEAHGCQALRTASAGFILMEFTSLIHQEEFMQLTAADIADIIRQSALKVPNEDVVFDAVVKWLNYDPSPRQRHVYELMQHVRFPLLSRNLLLAISTDTESPLNNSTAAGDDDVRCKNLLIEALSYQLMDPEERRSYSNSKRDDAVRRTHVRAPSVRDQGVRILAVGGQAPKAIRSFYCYEFARNQWHSLRHLPSHRCRAGAAVIDRSLYVVGGFDGSLRLRDVDACNLPTGEWLSMPPLQQRRSTLGVTVLRDEIYAVGGFDGQQGLASVEKFNPLRDAGFGGGWINVAPMSTRRSSVGVAVIDDNKLFAVGGFCGQTRVCLNTIEVYDAVYDRWAFVTPPMRHARSGAGVAALDRCLYVIGGHEGPQVKRSMEVLSVETGQYISCAAMHFERRNCVALAMGNCLYVIGGDNGVEELASVEVYDPRSDSWAIDVVQSLPTPISYAAMVVVDDNFELCDKF